jgi:hypothetical protein
MWKTCARSVNVLCTDRQQKFFFSSIALAKRARASMWMEFRQALRLISAGGCIECLTNSVPRQSKSLIVIPAVHRFEECIAGRDYLIEVSLVSKDRWRAYIVRLPGVPTALMPFYGPTPREAARQLSDWLTRAHGAANHRSAALEQVAEPSEP